MDFVFHCLYLINKYTYGFYPTICLVCPNIAPEEMLNNNNGEFSIDTLLHPKNNFLSNKKLKEILNRYGGKYTDNEIKKIRNINFSNKEDEKIEELYNEISNTFGFWYGKQLKEQCKGFVGTGVKAYMYLIQGYQHQK